MSATTTPETPEVQDVLDRALKLSVAEREVIARRLLDSVYPPPNSFASEDALRAELLRRVEAVENGTMKTYTLEETLDHIQKALDEGRKS